MPPSVEGYRLERSLEPDHPHCTISDPVYAGVDERTGERVAVKVLHLGFPLHPEAAAGFLGTLRRAREIRSPHVAQIVGSGFTAQPGAPWFAMEFVDGESLDVRLARGERFAPADAATLLAQLASALGAAHAVGMGDTHVIANHMILAPSRGLVVWNLGLASWSKRAHDLVAGQYTAPGQMRWHPDVTPDEAKGLPSRPENGAVALALLAFRLLAGRHYWNAADSASPMELLMEAMRPFEPPSARSRHALPAGFDAWFLECTSGRVGDMAAALETFPA